MRRDFHWTGDFSMVAYVYRLYDINGALLYVGMSARSAKRRIGNHLSLKHWGEDVERWQIVEYATPKAARQAEAEAIRTEKPRWNLDHRWGTPEERREWSDAQWYECFEVHRKLAAPAVALREEYDWVVRSRGRNVKGRKWGNQWTPGEHQPFVGPAVA